MIDILAMSRYFSEGLSVETQRQASRKSPFINDSKILQIGMRVRVF